MSVSSVSIEEIKAVRADTPMIIPTQEKKKQDVSSEKRYVDRFSDKNIAEFFAPYGYLTHERSKDGGTVLVLCDNCQIIFDDFTVMAEPHVSLFSDNSIFDFNKFFELCEQANTTPSQAISDRLEDEIFDSMPYYTERKSAFVQNNLANIKKNKSYASLLAATINKELHRENYKLLNKTYGSTDPEKIADTLARTIPGR